MKSKIAVLLFVLFTAIALSAQSNPYTSWLDKDVRWIITKAESSAFQQLDKDEYRDRFISQFWERRDPTPGTTENEFKEEHYRRIAYANSQFASKIDGALTDRGAVYIRYGPPDRIEHPRLQPSNTVLWVYERFGDSGKQKTLEFVDTCNCGDYRLTQREVIETPPSDPYLRKLLRQTDRKPL